MERDDCQTIPSEDELFQASLVECLFNFSHQTGLESLDQESQQILDCLDQIKSVPATSFAYRLCLLLVNNYSTHKNLSNLALVWRQVVDRLRQCWTTCSPIPDCGFNQEGNDGGTSGKIDYSHCLLQQKLQMINACIAQKIKRESLNKKARANDFEDEEEEFFDCDDQDAEQTASSSSTRAEGRLEQALDSITNQLLFLDGLPSEPLYVPITQDVAPLTEDMLHKQMDVLTSLEPDGGSGSAGSSLNSHNSRIRFQSAGKLSFPFYQVHELLPSSSRSHLRHGSIQGGQSSSEVL